jgi:hypothetical protein
MAIGAPSGNRPLPGGPRAGSGWRLRCAAIVWIHLLVIQANAHTGSK